MIRGTSFRPRLVRIDLFLQSIDKTVDTNIIRRLNSKRTVTLNIIPPENIALETGVEIVKQDVYLAADANDWTKGETKSVTNSLDLATAMVNDGKITPAINKLEAFINQIDARIQSGRMSPEEGQSLIDDALYIISQLSTGT